jgi:hypothetical protein
MSSISAARKPAHSPLRRWYVYVQSMLSERLQILLSPQQKRRLEMEAEKRGESVGGLVRAAIDASYGTDTTREERLAAVERMREGPVAARFFTPEELTRVHDEESERGYPEIFPPRETP